MKNKVYKKISAYFKLLNRGERVLTILDKFKIN